MLGNLLLKPSWAAAPTSENSTPTPDIDQMVHSWSRAVQALIKSHLGDEVKLSSELKTRYKFLAFGALVKLIIKALRLLGQSETLQVGTQFPSMIDTLFQQLTTKQRDSLIETLVNELENQSRVAFDCLDSLLETQL